MTGPLFNMLHLMFETEFNELWLAVDQIAERIRSVGAFAPGTYSQFSALTAIGDADGVPKAEDMIRDLVVGHETVVRIVRGVFPVADAAHDEPTTDLLTQRMEAHEKTAWMLRAMLG